MKKLIVLVIIATVLIIGVFIGARYLNQKTVTFTFDANDYSVVINDSDMNKIGELEAPGSLRLDTGTYSYQVIGNDYNNESVEFTVDSAEEISVKSAYTSEKMFTLLNQEVGQIRNLLINTYAQKASYDVENIQLHDRGDWASAFLIVTIPRQVPTTYRTVLHKEGDAWKIVIKPSLAINKADYKDVPSDIINSLYGEDN